MINETELQDNAVAACAGIQATVYGFADAPTDMQPVLDAMSTDVQVMCQFVGVKH